MAASGITHMWIEFIAIIDSSREKRVLEVFGSAKEGVKCIWMPKDFRISESTSWTYVGCLIERTL